MARRTPGTSSTPDPAPGAGPARRRLILLGVAALLWTSGCATHHASQGERGVSAAYRLRTLTVDLPASVRVPALMAAAEVALTERGYTISAREVTSDRGRIEARAPHANPDEGVSIVAEVAGGGTRGTVRVGRWGDEALSRSILDAVLVRLGL